MRAGSGRLSEKIPKRGCTTEELTVAPSTRAPAAARVRSRSITRKGNNAGTAPWLRSVNRCPADNTAIARRSTPFLGVVLKSDPFSYNGRQRTAGILPVFRDLVRRDGPDPGCEEFADRLLRPVDHLPSRLDGVPRRWTAAPGRGDLEQHARRVPLYLAQLSGFAQRLPETADLVRQTELARLDASPDPPCGDVFEVTRFHAPPARDAILELAVDKADLSFQDLQLVGRRTAAKVEQPGPGAALQGDGVHAELFVEIFGDGADGKNPDRAGDGIAPGDDVVCCRRDVVAAGGCHVAHEYDHGLLGVDALDLAPDQVRCQRVAAGRLDVEEYRRHAPISLRQTQRSEERRVGKECRSRWSPYH